MGPTSESAESANKRKSGARKQAATWLTPEQIEQVWDACLTNVFPSYLQGGNETITTVLADTGL